MAIELWHVVVILVLGIIAAAGNSFTQRACPIDPVSVPYMGSRPPDETVWSNGISIDSLEKIVVGPDPEDLAFDSHGRIYTALGDGWIKSFGVDGTVENHTYVGGRPLGIFVGPEDEIYFADTYKGLFKISKDGEVHFLANEGGGKKIGFGDGVVVAKNGVVYLTDASWKFGIAEFMFDFLEGNANGRLLQYDPSTNSTKVLHDKLFFANGVMLSENEDFLLVSETSRARILRYWLKGEQQGTFDTFIEGLPGYPDNVRLSDDGNFYIGMPSGRTMLSDLIMRISFKPFRCLMTKQPFLKFIQKMSTRAVLIVVSPDGKVLKKYEDAGRKVFKGAVTGGIKVGNFLYVTGIGNDLVGRLKL